MFVALWGERPITSIAKGDVLALIEGVRDHGTPATLAPRGKGAKAPQEARPGACPQSAWLSEDILSLGSSAPTSMGLIARPVNSSRLLTSLARSSRTTER